MTPSRILLALFMLALSAPAFAGIGDTDVTASLAARGLLLTAVLVFAGGVAVSLTPCVYPMIPITLSIIGARSAEQKPIIGFTRSLIFVLGIATVYTGLGYFAVSTGRTFGFVFQNVWFVAFIALFFMLMGLSMMDLFTIQLPATWAGKLQGSANRGGYIGAFLLGLVTGIVASPCGSPVLLGVLAVAAQSGKGAVGVSLLFSYALGLGLLFLVLGTFPAFLGKLPRSGVWMEDVKKALGLVLIAIGFYYLGGPLAELPLVFWGLSITAAIAGAAVMAVYANKRSANPSLKNFWRLGGVAALSFAVYASVAKAIPAFMTRNEVVEAGVMAMERGEDILPPATLSQPAVTDSAATATATADTQPAAAPELDWLTSETEALAKARELGKPVMIDFTAKWCTACKQLEKLTFSKPEVQAVLRDFVLLKVDCTKQTDENQALQRKYGALSLPTIAFTKPDGEIAKDLSLYKFEEAPEFLERLSKVPR